MYKYSFKGQVHTARDFFEARHKAGVFLPLTTSTISYYVVRLWQWDEADRDYTVEILSPPGYQIFNSHDEAMVCYNTQSEFLPSEITEDLKLELVQIHLEKIYALESKVLCPPVTDWQW